MSETVIYLFREGLILAAILSLPPLGAAWLAQLGCAYALRATGIPEATGTTHAPQLLAVTVAMVVAAPWTLEQLVNFTQVVFETMLEVSR